MERWGDGLGEFEEESFAPAGALALMQEAELLAGAAAQLDKVEMVSFKPSAKVETLGCVEAFRLELDAVEFDA